MVRPITSGNKGGGGLEKRIPLLVGLGIGCVIGYLVGLAATPTPTTLSSLLLSPTATTTTVAVVPTAAAAAAVVEKEDGWNNLHVYYGKPNSPHLELLTPMAQAKQDEYVAAMLKNKKQGYFVDLAAHDATYLSNTFKLEQDHDWNGRKYQSIDRIDTLMDKRRNAFVYSVLLLLMLPPSACEPRLII